MDARRDYYLGQLGIDRWVPRHAPAAGAALSATLPRADAARVDAPARDAGEHADTWEQLRTEVAACEKCALCGTRTQPVFGVGDVQARWLVIGEAPGAEEDRRGEPFVGRAGQLLNAMLRAVGLPRENVFIANMLKCRPPNNRDPSGEELAACRPYLERQIALVAPSIVLAVGRIAAQNLLGSEMPLGRLRGRAHELANGTPVVVTYHPAYLLRSPADKRKAWEDLKFARSLSTGRG